MKTTIGRGLVAALLLAAGCSSNDNNGSTGGGGSSDAGMGGTGGSIGSGGRVGTGAGGSTMGGSLTAGAGGSGGAGAGGNAGSGGGTAGGIPDSGSGGYPAGDGGPLDASTGNGGTGGGGDGPGGRDGGGSDGPPTTTPVPPELDVPAGAVLKIQDHGVGVQIYTCTASAGADAGVDAGATTYAWLLKAPDAQLFDWLTYVQVGTHGAGPHWTSTVDGSVVNGTKVAQVDAPLATAIPWLLLRATSTSGTGVFSDVTYVQRVNTTGGKAPATGCDSTTVGTDVRVDYTADYYFYMGGAGADWMTPPAGIPTVLAVPAGAMLKIHDHAIGAQIYTCTASGGVDGGVDAGSATYAWVLKAPDAILYDATFAQVGTHGAGPHWTSLDGSTVNGVKVQQDSTYQDAIPWLLLQGSSTSGSGVFTDITYVQRLNTAGGKAPATGCDATAVNTDTRVGYSADYYFYTSGASDGGATGQ
jgi:hypothetical protein